MPLDAAERTALEIAERLLRDLDDTNSAFPATQQFLRSRGLTHVGQLDKDARSQLLEHLQQVLRLSTN